MLAVSLRFERADWGEGVFRFGIFRLSCVHAAFFFFFFGVALVLILEHRLLRR